MLRQSKTTDDGEKRSVESEIHPSDDEGGREGQKPEGAKIRKRRSLKARRKGRAWALEGSDVDDGGRKATPASKLMEPTANVGMGRGQNRSLRERLRERLQLRLHGRKKFPDESDARPDTSPKTWETEDRPLADNKSNKEGGKSLRKKRALNGQDRKKGKARSRNLPAADADSYDSSEDESGNSGEEVGGQEQGAVVPHSNTSIEGVVENSDFADRFQGDFVADDVDIGLLLEEQRQPVQAPANSDPYDDNFAFHAELVPQRPAAIAVVLEGEEMSDEGRSTICLAVVVFLATIMVMACALLVFLLIRPSDTVTTVVPSLAPSWTSNMPSVAPTLAPLLLTSREELDDHIRIYMLDVSQGVPSFLPKMGSWNVSLITDMSRVFSGSDSRILRFSFNEDVSGWDVSNVVTMDVMFEFCEEFNHDLSRWDTSRVTSMSGMFAYALRFNANISTWNVSRVTSMEYMFLGAEEFNQDLSTWNTSRVQRMLFLFKNALKFNGNISHWSTSSVTDTRHAFDTALAFDQPLYWDVSRVTSMFGMFRVGTKADILIKDFDFHSTPTVAFNGDISSWNTSSVTSMVMMFRRATFFNQDITNFDTSSVTNMRNMFDKAKSFNRDISRWNTSRVTNMRRMFDFAESFNQDLSRWDISNVFTAHSMFWNASSFNQNLCSWRDYLKAQMDIHRNSTFGMFFRSGCEVETFSYGAVCQACSP